MRAANCAICARRSCEWRFREIPQARRLGLGGFRGSLCRSQSMLEVEASRFERRDLVSRASRRSFQLRDRLIQTFQFGLVLDLAQREFRLAASVFALGVLYVPADARSDRARRQARP